MKGLIRRSFRVWIAGSVALAGIAAAVHCGSSEPLSVFDAGNGDPCETTFKGQCGVACSSDETCAAGLHCAADKKCTADCTPNIRGKCPDGVSCSRRGRCGSDPTEGGLVDGSFDAATDTTCAAIDVDVTKVVPTVLLVIDQSSSMEYDFAGANLMPPNFPNSRWVKLRESLMDPDGGIIKKYEKEIGRASCRERVCSTV